MKDKQNKDFCFKEKNHRDSRGHWESLWKKEKKKDEKNPTNLNVF